MSWCSIVSKKPEIQHDEIKEVIKEVNIERENTTIDDDTCVENFESKYDLDLFDFCFDLKDNMDKSSDILLKIDSFKIENFIKEYIDYSKYNDQEKEKELDNEFENL
jgi:hypothetical protein